jgi:hypothetical protein
VPTLLDSAKQALQAVVNKWKAIRLDGKVTFSEFIEFSRAGVKELMTVIAPFALDGKTKKQLVLEFAGQLYDFFAPLIIARLATHPWLFWMAWFFTEDRRDEFLTAVTIIIQQIFGDEFQSVPAGVPALASGRIASVTP